MRITAIMAGLFLCVVTFLTINSKVHAEAPQPIILASSTNITDGKVVLEAVNTQFQQQNAATKDEKKPQEHLVAEGETLTSIANQYQTSWQRLYAKNTAISSPDIIDVGQKVVIPASDEQLAERAAPVSAPEPAQPTTSTSAPKRQAATVSRGSAGGNSYSYGYCTWYAKNKRPDLPNNLGDASTWVARAAAQGISTGSAPRTGAIGQRGNHVVYVEAVNGDGSVSISEMNHAGWNVVSTRTVPGSYFSYIY